MDGGRSVPDGARGGVRSSEVGAQSADADGSLPAEADERFMARAVELARRGAGWTSPNPLVGAVIVRDGRIIGEGWHHRFGGPHAEREALAACSESPAGATAYVTLEPCCHTGKTPPCTEALIEAGIARVVVGVLDPNPLVAGRGNEALRRAGIEVAVGVLEPSCRAVNEPFRSHGVFGYHHGTAPSPGDSQIRHDLGREGGHAGGAFSLGDRRGGAPPRS